jgi:predicted Zn-dependent protease
MLAGVLAYIDFNFPDAEREFERTLDLDPNEATARTAYANVLLILRRPDEAMPQIERAVAIDPLFFLPSPVRHRG